MRTVASPYMHWAKICSSARYNLATSGLMSYPLAKLPVSLDQLELTRGGGYGYAPLVEAIAAHERVSPRNVVTATGTSMANHLAMAAILEPGDEVLVERPAYELLLSVLEYLRADIHRFERRERDGWALDPDAVGCAMTPRTRLIVTTNLHNPAGVLAGQAELAAIGALARRNGARVLVDEVYLDAVFDGGPGTAFLLGEEFVTTNSLTKVYGLSGLRCGWILADEKLATRIYRLDDLFGVNPAYPAELLSCAAFANLGKIRAGARDLLERNREVLNLFLATRGDLAVMPQRWGTVVFPRLLTGSVDAFCRLLREKYETSVVPGSFFEMPEHFRIGTGGGTEALVAGLERLGAALDEFGARG